MPVPVDITHGRVREKLGNNEVLPEVMSAASSWASLGRKGGDNGVSVPAPQQLEEVEHASVQNGAGVVPLCPHGIEVNNLTFRYVSVDGRPLPGPPQIDDVSFSLPKGSCTLLVGANGAGKTTLLRVLGGQSMVNKSSVKVLGQPPFHTTSLVSSGKLSYIGGTWQQDIAFAGYSVPLTGDFPAGQMIDSIRDVPDERRKRLMEVLDINEKWRMHQVSDGQRRRVQLAIGLLKPFEVLLLDEVTVDLDALARASLLSFLKEEARDRGATIVYTTHIFDGMEAWPDHILMAAAGKIRRSAPITDFPELEEGTMLELVDKWLREEKELAKVAKEEGKMKNEPKRKFDYSFNNGYVAGTLVTSLAGSSNSVLRN